MSIYLDISAKSAYLHVEATGEFSFEGVERAFLTLLEAVAQYKAIKVLVDARRLTGHLKFIERYRFGKLASENVRAFTAHGVSPATQFAYVLNSANFDPDRFVEKVARSRGMCAREFEERVDDALRWLDVESDGN